MNYLLFIYRLIRNLAVLFCIALPLEISGWFILLVVLLFVPKTQLKLPRAFIWFDCADMYVGRDYSVYQAVCAQGYWARYLWLAWRNPCNYFGYTHLSFIFNSTGKYLIANPNEFNVGNTTGAIPGFRYIEYVQNDGTYYEYCWIKKWNSAKCLRFRMGWKIENNSNPINSYCQWVTVLQPYIDYSGK